MKISTEQNKNLPCVIYNDYILYLCKLFDFYLIDIIIECLEYIDADLLKRFKPFYIYLLTPYVINRTDRIDECNS